MATTLVRFQHRRKTAAQWTSGNEVLLAGEPGVETDTGRWKLGDGATPWGTLAYQVSPVSPGFTGQFGVNAATTTRQPMTLRQIMNGATVRAEPSGNDKIGFNQQTIVTGDFTGDTGGNPGFLWGQNIYLVTGSTAGDGKGITTLTGGLIEAAVSTPAGTTFPLVQGMATHVSLSGASAGATISQAESLRVSAPVKKDGATGGQITNAYGLFVESVSAGTASNFSLFVEGGVSRFQGRVDLWNTIANGGGTDLDIFAGYTNTDGAHLRLQTAGNSGHLVAQLTQPGAHLFVHDGTNVKHALGTDGVLGVGSYPDTAGGSGPMVYVANVSIPPAGNPVGGGLLYVQAGALKYRGSSGTVTTIGAA